MSVDIPSGWPVEGGDASDEGIKPDMLLCTLKRHESFSLKIRLGHAARFSDLSFVLFFKYMQLLCSLGFFNCIRAGHRAAWSLSHSRWKICLSTYCWEYKLHLPPYTRTSMCIHIGKVPQIDVLAISETPISSKFLDEQLKADLFDQIREKTLFVTFSISKIFINPITRVHGRLQHIRICIYGYMMNTIATWRFKHFVSFAASLLVTYSPLYNRQRISWFCFVLYLLVSG